MAHNQDIELFSFNAGRTNDTFQGDGKWLCKADARKGKLCLIRDADGSFKLLWKLRPSNKIAEEIPLTPGNNLLEKVSTGVETDRVYILRYKSSSQRFFFWMQDGDPTTDLQNYTKLKELIGTAVDSGSGIERDSQSISTRPLHISDLSNVLESMDFVRPSNLNEGAGEGETKEDKNDATTDDKDGQEGQEIFTPSASTLNCQISGIDLQRTTDGVQSVMSSGAEYLTPPLEQIYDSAVLQQLIDTDDAMKNRLVELLHENQQSAAELHHTLSSPQLRQAMIQLSRALNDGESFNSIMANFGLDPIDGELHLQRGDFIAAFLAALQARADRERNNGDVFDPS